MSSASFTDGKSLQRDTPFANDLRYVKETPGDGGGHYPTLGTQRRSLGFVK